MKKRKHSFGPRRTHAPTVDQSRSKVFSYRANQLTTDENKARNRVARTRQMTLRFKWQYVPAMIAFAALFICVVSMVSLSSNAKISVLSSEQTAPGLLRGEAAYTEAAKQILGRSINAKTKLSIDSVSFDRQMKERFPEIAQTSITLPLMGRRPIVELAIVRPSLLISTTRGVYVVDDRGRAIMDAREVKGVTDLKLPVVSDEAGPVVKAGQKILTEQAVTFITTFNKQLQNKGVSVRSISPAPSATEVSVRLNDYQYIVKASLATDPRLAAGRFLALKGNLEQQRISPAEYIDVRVEERAYYK